MIYILIFALAFDGFQKDPITSQAVEFNSLEACQAAGKVIREQISKVQGRMPVFLCAAKGVK